MKLFRKKECKVPIRFWIACMVFFTTYINYTTRVNMSISIVSMVAGSGGKKDIPECLREKGSNDTGNTTLPDYGPRYEWNEHIQSQILGSYFWGYVILSLPGGFIAEWLGPYWTIIGTEAISAVMNFVSIYAPDIHWGFLVFCRFIVGLCAGPTYPALQCLIARWAPPAEKGKFVAALMGNTLGTCVTWPLVGSITKSYGWDWGFHVVTIQKVVFLAIFAFITADSPADHKMISEEEKDFIAESQAGTVTKAKAVPPYLKIFTSLPFWALQVLHFGNLWGLYLQITNVPKYLSQVIGFDIKNAGFLAALPHLTRLFLGTGFGSLGDYLKKKKGVPNKFIRKFFVLFSHIFPGVFMIGIIFCGCDSVPIVVLLILSQAVNGAAVLTNLSNPQDLAPNFAGSIFGIISFIGGMTGFIVPAVTGAFIYENSGVEEYKGVFILGGCMYIGCGLFFIIFGRTETQKWNEKKDSQEEAAGASQPPK